MPGQCPVFFTKLTECPALKQGTGFQKVQCPACTAQWLTMLLMAAIPEQVGKDDIFKDPKEPN